MTILYIILGIILFLNVISFIVNKLVFSRELECISPYGELVNVNGGNMHVYSMGKGPQTIVLLPGFGVPLPSADFGPLMRELSKHYRVVCIEYFGIGFSDKTKLPRTNENYVKEIRTALKSAGFAPPYVLMPHSGSGIYSEYFATKYPNEVSAIIMLDTTTSAMKGANVPKFVYKIGKGVQAVGLSRMVNAIVVPSLLKVRNGYTKREISDYGKFINHSLNDNVIDQDLRLNDNINEVMGMEFPEKIPVLKIIPKATIKQCGEEYQEKHINRLGRNARFITTEGSHFIYHSNVSDICDLTNSFLTETVR